MQLTFGNMTLELNIFHLSNKHKPAEDERPEFDEVCSIGLSVGPNAQILQEEMVKKSEAVEGELTASIAPAEPMIPPTPPSGKNLNTKELSMKANAANSTGGVKELLLLDPP